MANGEATNVAEVKMFFTQDNQQVMNTHHFINGAGWDAGSLQNIGIAVREWWDTNMKQHVVTNVTLREIQVTDLTPGSGQQITIQDGLPISGTNNQAPMSNNVTVAVKKGTGLRGRSFRGRTFHIGLSKTQVVENELAPVVVGQLQDAYNELRDPNGIVLPGDLCVLSLIEDGAERPDGVCTVVTGIGINPVVDSQRRRLPERGR